MDSLLIIVADDGFARAVPAKKCDGGPDDGEEHDAQGEGSHVEDMQDGIEPAGEGIASDLAVAEKEGSSVGVDEAEGQGGMGT